jgi:predicted amidohydrolase YtcJ
MAPAQVILRGATVFTSNPARRWAEAVAVREGRIIFVGPHAELESHREEDSHVVDLPGCFVLPGFQDAHVHPDHGGLDRARCDLYELSGREQYVSAVERYAAGHPDAAWILGGGWTLSDFPRGTPHRSLLDAVVPDRPAYLPNRDGHGAWVNTRALDLAGVTRDTPDPPDGRIERDEDGTPFGVVHEGAMKLVSRLIPPPTPGELEAALLEAQAHLHSLGVTAWQDAHLTRDSLAAYRSLAERGDLSARVVGALWWDRYRGDDQVEELLELRAAGTVGRFQATAVKIMQDGIIENFTAGMLDPYLDPNGSPTSGRGLSFVEPEALRQHVVRLDREGFQVHVHAIGDRAVREALDAFEAALAANGPTAARHHIAHLQVVHPDDVPRFARLGVVANAQPLWACLDDQMRDLCLPTLGPERSTWQYPFGDLMRSGAIMAFGSDWPVTTPDPLKEMQVAVTRVPHDGPGRDPFLPGQRVGLTQALDAFTRGSAFVNHLDDMTGSLEVGKLADLVILDRNPFSEGGSIGDARVLLTMIEGDVVFADRSIRDRFPSRSDDPHSGLSMGSRRSGSGFSNSSRT